MLPRQRLRIDAVMQNGARGRLQKKNQGAADGGLSRAGFPDDPEGLAAADVEVDAVDRLHGRPAIQRLKADLEVADRDDRIWLLFGG